MFKKIEIWILYLVILLGIPATVFFGILVRHELLGGKRLGWISKSALFLTEIPVNLKDIFTNNLQSEDRFPYLDGFNGTPNQSESYLLLSRHDGNLREGIVELVDLQTFNVLHTWNPDIDKFNRLVPKDGEFKNLQRDGHNARQELLSPNLTIDGGLLFNSGPLRKIDACSKLVYQVFNDGFHHSIETDSENNIWVPSTMYPQSLPIYKVGRSLNGFVDDAIVKLSPNGEVLFEKSVSQILIDNGLEYLLFSTGASNFTLDPIHLNDIQPVDFDGKFWQKGDVFLSLRQQSMIILYRPLTNKIIWKGTGPFFHQHDVNILNEHKISIFDNHSKDFVGGDTVDGNNRVVIYDFKTNKYSTYLNQSLIENDVRTLTSGRSQILDNGDLFLEETVHGRTLYINADGSLRWTHYNRDDNKKVYRVAWSRILHNDKDIKNVNNFLNSRRKCS